MSWSEIGSLLYTTLVWISGAVAVVLLWAVAALPLAKIVGRVIRNRDREG